MPRFLHLADIHLGFDRYDSKERTKDFFWALQDAIQKYAVDEQVDFVAIAGDLFEHRNIQPGTLNQAKICLKMLQEANIPVLAIEGNHDNRPYGTQASWLRYLCEDGWLILLEPGNPALGEPLYSPWDGSQGGYIDLDCGVRVFGSYWYGASAPRAIANLAEAIQQLPPGPNHAVMLFHHGLEGQIARYQGALRYSDLLPLKQAGIDYLALGHIHKHYTQEGWIFNPGSLEANSIEESKFERGVYLVEINQSGIRAELKRAYYQRAIVQLKVTVRGQESLEEVEAAAITSLQTAIQSGKVDPEVAPIVELRIEGQVGFDRLDLDTRKLQQQLQQISKALIFLLKYNVDTVEYASPLSEDASRLEVEQEVFTDLLAANNTYKKRAIELAQGLIDLKDLQFQGQEESELYEFVQNLLN
ncbi:DNA repair exonuclease [Kovacikia minuta CCNUW1]|uniref:metallophosphoesterase family protein n=1 Tax=Kovacikia minuta TaxID=2931930 RepID=UPI001CCB516A|nr:DNA repair exonuclease [Kovacikia minuta]UBF25092.1 DNA repair exonuclease [Kovacikia minuta CCNUW1]